ncbi:hypothetical protein F5Y10DRAFT_260272 [Nemania abortiva]|nr:hypothetical protein F5Y10DRAFT_260272 [Nemania abortiva]
MSSRSRPIIIETTYTTTSRGRPKGHSDGKSKRSSSKQTRDRYARAPVLLPFGKVEASPLAVADVPLHHDMIVETIIIIVPLVPHGIPGMRITLPPHAKRASVLKLSLLNTGDVVFALTAFDSRHYPPSSYRDEHYFTPRSRHGSFSGSFSGGEFPRPERSHTYPGPGYSSHPGPAPAPPHHPGPAPHPGPDARYYYPGQSPGFGYQGGAGPIPTPSPGGQYYSGYPGEGYPGDSYFRNPPPAPRPRDYTPPRHRNEDGEEVIRPSSISEPDSDDDEVHHRSGPDPSLKVREAQKRGKADHERLKLTINIVLIHEWYLHGNQIDDTIPNHFTTEVTVIPVVRIQSEFGAFQAIKSLNGSWGVVTGYDPDFSLYVAVIMILVPGRLRNMTQSEVTETYKRFTIKPRSEKLMGLPDLPFNYHPDYRNYAILFKFESGGFNELYSMYLREDAVIRL